MFISPKSFLIPSNFRLAAVMRWSHCFRIACGTTGQTKGGRLDPTA
jgi:hypothetical protein